MSLPKISSFLLSIYILSVRYSVPTTASVSPVPIAYRRITPPNIVPFAASVSTFTKGLNVYAAPYAAGVASVPFYTRSLIPGNEAVPIPYGAFGPGLIHSSTPGVVAPVVPNPAIATANGILPSPLLPSPFRVPQDYVTRTTETGPGVFGVQNIYPGLISPSHLLPAPFGLQGRSVHAVAPAVPISPAVIG